MTYFFGWFVPKGDAHRNTKTMICVFIWARNSILGSVKSIQENPLNGNSEVHGLSSILSFTQIFIRLLDLNHIQSNTIKCCLFYLKVSLIWVDKSLLHMCLLPTLEFDNKFFITLNRMGDFFKASQKRI